MWWRIPTLIVFGHLQVGIWSNPLSLTNEGYVFTAGIGYHKVHSLAKTSDIARSICQDEGGDLAIIDSYRESRIIVALLMLSLPHTGSYNSSYALVGFHGRIVDVQNPTFQVENLQPAVYNEQGWHEPSIARREGENCESIDSNGQVNGISCDQPYAFVCERPEFGKEICGKPVEMNVTVAKELIIEEGKVSIACYVIGYPDSRILWYKDDELVQTNDRINVSGNELIIPKANKNDAGKYRCETADKHKSGAHTVDIKVIVPVKVRIAVDDRPFLKGTEISIVCNTDGYPIPTIRWFKDDDHIQNNGRTNIVAHKLIISTAEKNDTGKYRCEAANEYTSSAETVDIRVAGTSKPLDNAIEGYKSTPGIGCHKIHSLAKTWDRARSVCKEEGGDLAIINSKTESEAIAQLFTSSLPHIGSEGQNYAHIGFNDRDVEGHYVTIDSETLVGAGFNEWHENEPSNGKGNEDCGSISKNGKLNDIPCDRKVAFVCERPQYEETICGRIVEVKLTVINEIIVEGGKVSIACNVAGYPAPSVLWYKNNDLIRKNNRINISGANKLIILRANKNDSGKYRCKAANKYMSDSQTVNIKVIVPVKVRIAVDDGPFPEGSRISIACNTSGYPTPTVQWYKNGNRIGRNKRIYIVANKLIIFTAEENDTGKYRCSAANEYTSSAEAVNIKVTVPVKVRIAVDDGPFPEGGEISIACNTDGYPTPTVQWYKDDNHIKGDERINIVANKLIISTAEENDAGKYRCEAANEYTSSAEVVDIKVAEKVSGMNCPPLRSESVDFDCKYHDETVSCECAIAPWTRATLACKNFYKLPSGDDPGYGEITCLENGAWSRPVFDCIPGCGTEIADETQLGVNGSKVLHARFPWIARIYKIKSTGSRLTILEGTLISPHLVLSQAFWFYNEDSQKVVNARDYVVVAGQFSGTYPTLEPYAQESAIKRIDIATNYLGKQGDRTNKAALIHVETPFSMTTLVRPICIDWENEFELKQRQSMEDAKKVYGWVPKSALTGGWESQEVDSTFIPREECLSRASDGRKKYVKDDTFCVPCTNGFATCIKYPTEIYYESHGIWYLLGVHGVIIRSEDSYYLHVYEYGPYLDRIRAALLTAF